MKSLKTILQSRKLSDQGKYITREYQDFGLRLAQTLNDHEHKSLYIKLAKYTPRHLLERALWEVKDATKVRSKAHLFMWKLKQLKTSTMSTSRSGGNLNN